MILKISFAFLLGFILGAIGVGFLVTSGAGNYLIAPVIAANPRVQELEGKIREVEDQRAALGRQLDKLADRLDQIGSRFEDLQRRFESLQRASGGAGERPGSGVGSTGPPAP
jgi:cell division protein FtsB